MIKNTKLKSAYFLVLMLIVVLCILLTSCGTQTDASDEIETEQPMPPVSATQMPSASPTKSSPKISEPTNNPTISADPVPMTEEERELYRRRSELVNEAIAAGFGDIGVDDMIEQFDEPDRIDKHKHFARWYYDEGFEIDYTTMSDYPVFENYIYIGPDCKVDFCRGVIPGSAREELLMAYSGDIDPTTETENIVWAGKAESQHGIAFVIDNDTVDSIYISISSHSIEYWGDFVPDR